MRTDNLCREEAEHEHHGDAVVDDCVYWEKQSCLTEKMDGSNKLCFVSDS